jgi:starvation-inducible DNA-binding protein
MTRTENHTTVEVQAGLGATAVNEISDTLRKLLADAFALYIKTKNFHWHITGRHFRDYHLLLDEQAGQIFEMTDDIAERARKIGGTTLHSIGDISRHQRLEDSDDEHFTPLAMISQLHEDNVRLTAYMREAHEVCGRHNDVATTSVIEVWIDQAERRSWFLREVLNER